MYKTVMFLFTYISLYISIAGVQVLFGRGHRLTLQLYL